MPTWDRQLYENTYLPIAKGEVNGHSVVFITGKNPDTNGNETVWNVGGLYPWATWDAGPATLYINSTSASDTSALLLNGLDENYNILTTTVALNGTSFVNTGVVQFYRLNSAVVIGGNPLLGQVNIRYGSTTGTIVGRIEDTVDSTSMAIYTVPAGHTAYSVYGDFSVNRNENAELNAMWRFFGGTFVRVYATEVYQQAFKANPPVPGAIPEKTDIDNRVRFTENPGTRVYSNQQLILVRNDALHV